MHAASSFEPSGSPRKPATRLAPRPKTAPAGGVALNVLNAITQASCVARAAGGHAAERAAAVRLRADRDVAAEQHGGDEPAAQGAMRVDAAADEPFQVVAALRVAEEDEAATRADAAEERVERLLDVAVGREVVLRVVVPAWSAGTVACRYTGAYTRQSCEKRAAW